MRHLNMAIKGALKFKQASKPARCCGNADTKIFKYAINQAPKAEL